MTYLGYEVLDINPNRVGRIEEVMNRKVAVLDPRTGKRSVDEQAPAARPSRPFTWTALGRTEIAAMRAFLEARKGIAVPFWFPSWQWDLSLNEDLAQTSAVVTIRWVRYAQQMFGTTGARRHLSFWPYALGTPLELYKIADADEPGNGQTETLTITPAATRLYPKDSTVLSFLKLCRLADEETEVHYWADSSAAEATIMIRELPREAPL